MKEQYEITDAELEIMQVLWKNRECNLTTITQELSRNENKNKNTIKTLIHRLIQKGAIESQKINNKEVVYVPKINKKKFMKPQDNGNPILISLSLFVSDCTIFPLNRNWILP